MNQAEDLASSGLEGDFESHKDKEWPDRAVLAPLDRGPARGTARA